MFYLSFQIFKKGTQIQDVYYSIPPGLPEPPIFEISGSISRQIPAPAPTPSQSHSHTKGLVKIKYLQSCE